MNQIWQAWRSFAVTVWALLVLYWAARMAYRLWTTGSPGWPFN